MDEVAPAVFQPEDGDGEFAIIVDRGDAPVLRDALKKAADRAGRRNPTMRHAKQVRDRELRVLSKYAERLEHVRLAEAQAFVERMRALLSPEKEEEGGR